MPQTSIRRCPWIGSLKINRSRLRPHGVLFDLYPVKRVSRHMLAKPACNFRIGLESHNPASLANEPRRKQRKKPDVRADIVKSHARQEMFLQRLLHFGFASAVEIISSGPGI